MAPVCTIHMKALALEPKTEEEIVRHAEIMAAKKAAVANPYEEVKEEVNNFDNNAKAPIEAPLPDNLEDMAPKNCDQDALYFTG